MPRGTKRIGEVRFIPNKDIIMYSGTSIYHKGLRDWQNLFAIKSRFRYVRVLFRIFYYYWVKNSRSLYRRTMLIEVRYIEVPP